MDRGVSVAVFQNDSKSSHNEMVSDFDQQKQSEVASYLWVLRPYHRVSGEPRRGLPSDTDQDILSEALFSKWGHFIFLNW